MQPDELRQTLMQNVHTKEHNRVLVRFVEISIIIENLILDMCGALKKIMLHCQNIKLIVAIKEYYNIL